MSLETLKKLYSEYHQTYGLDNNIRIELENPEAASYALSLQQSFSRGKEIFHQIFENNDTEIMLILFIKTRKKCI